MQNSFLSKFFTFLLLLKFKIHIMKKITTFFLFTVLCASVNAQWSVGGKFDMTTFSKDYFTGSFYGPSLYVGYTPEDDGVSYYGSFTYHLPNKETAGAVTLTSNLFAISVGAKYLFSGDYSEGLGFYGIFSANLMSISQSESGTGASGSDVSVSGVLGAVGLGAQYNLGGSGTVFFDAQYRLAFSSYNSRTGATSSSAVPSNSNLAIGYRINLGGE
jgi:hypothetical protein